MKNESVMAWHFTGATLRDGRAVPAIGEPLRHTGKLVICAAGLHASVDPFDALQYATGPLLHRVRCDGVSRSRVARQHTDKIVCRTRTIVATIDATALLRRFACDQAIEALRVAGVTPPEIVADYLRTGGEAARVGALEAALGTALGAKRQGAHAAAREAACEAAREAACEAAREAACVTWRHANMAALWASVAAPGKPGSAAWHASESKTRADFNARVTAAFGGEA